MLELQRKQTVCGCSLERKALSSKQSSPASSSTDAVQVLAGKGPILVKKEGHMPRPWQGHTR